MRGLAIAVLLALVVVACLTKQSEPLPELPGLAPFLQEDRTDIESAIGSMSLEQKLGQLIVVARDGQPEQQLHRWVRDGRVGGVALSGLSLPHFLSLRDSLQRTAPYPLFYTTSGGAPFSNQFAGAAALPEMDALLALPSDSLKQQLSRSFLRQAEYLGLNVVSAPYLSHLDQRYPLSEPDLQRHARAVNWLNERHILNIADGFAALSLLQPEWEEQEDSLFQGFQHLVKAGLSGFWIHPSVYAAQELPPDALDHFFRGRLQFDGLLVARLQEDKQLDEILESGVDLIVTHNSPDFVMNYLLGAYRAGDLSEQRLHAKLRRILLAKKWGRRPPPSAEPEHRPADAARTLPASMIAGKEGAPAVLAGEKGALAHYFTDERWRYWQRTFQEESITVASNPDSLLPYRELARRDFRVFHLGSGDGSAFDEAFGKYAALSSWSGASWEEFTHQLRQLHSTEDVVVALHHYPLDSLKAAALRSLARRLPFTLVNFQQLDNLTWLDSSLAVVHSFDGNEEGQALAAQVLMGGIPAGGKLPYTLNEFFRKGQGKVLPQIRLRYGLPEQAGIAPQKLVGIDAIVQTAIDEGAFPGCQAVIVKGGTVVYDKAMGYHTYDKERPARPNDLYDVASITKAAATALATMKLYEEGAIKTNARLRKQMGLPRSSRLRNLTVKKLMTHQSGLQPHMPVVPYLLSRDMENADCSRYFCTIPSDTFTIEVARDFYFGRRYHDQIFKDVHRLRPRYRYRYSDVNFILMQQLVEEKAAAPLDSFVEAHFYSPLGLRHTGFRPRLRWSSGQIVPTQLDRRWRHQLVHGYVHDETAALLGGVAGNAGLFSTAEDLAVLFQMLLNGGAYGGARYLEEETVHYFTSARHGNHRGLGFDKPDDKAVEKGKFPEQASEATFGHTGFTGTCAWADPEQQLTYVFLSNRIYPDTRNRRIFEKRVRERIHQVIYDALGTYTPEMPEL